MSKSVLNQDEFIQQNKKWLVAVDPREIYARLKDGFSPSHTDKSGQLFMLDTKAKLADTQKRKGFLAKIFKW